MKTTPDHIQRARLAHHAALETLRAPDCPHNGLTLWRKLRHIEALAHKAAEAACNGYLTTEEAGRLGRAEMHHVCQLFRRQIPGLYFNTDPRGGRAQTGLRESRYPRRHVSGLGTRRNPRR